MRCAKCGRWLRNPGIECVIGGATVILGPVCAIRVHGMAKPKRREIVIPYTRKPVVRVDQPGLFG